ncbi:hypothetical protein [Croceiramulus getboli]|nr:hypothetical protein P8624_02540 [Flavobacteriaceae bacterium YJPT1-3]
METISQEPQPRMTYKDWALNIFLASLPLIGFILLLVWAFGDDSNPTRKEWAKGYLFIFLIYLIIIILFMVLFGGLAAFGALLNN